MILYTIKEFADILENQHYHITRNKLRHYEREGLIKPIRRQHGNSEYRYYTDQDIDTVKAITNLISLSWKAKEVAALLRLNQELNGIIEKMKKTNELLLSIFKGESVNTEDPHVSNELQFWKNFEGGFAPEIVNKIFEHYSSNKSLNKKDTSVTAAVMLEKMQIGVQIVSGYSDRISKNEKEILELQQQIYSWISKIYKK